MKRIICFLIIFTLIIASAYSEKKAGEEFTLFFSKDGVSTFYFDPAEVIAFQAAEDANTVATAKFSVNWRLFLDEGFKLTLEASATNVDSNEDNYCLMHSNGLFGLNYLMQIRETSIIAGSSNNQNKLSKAARTLTIAENTGSSELPVMGDLDIILSIPYPKDQYEVAINGIYTGYLILTLTHN